MVDTVSVTGPAAPASESTRGRIVAAGVELLDASGIEGVGLRAIARRAGVSHGAPRRYFPTHAELLAAIARTGIDDLAQTVRPPLRDHSREPRARLLAAAQAYLEFARRRRAMFELMFRHDILDGAGGDLRGVSVPLLSEWQSVVADLVGGAQSWQRALQLWASLHGLAVLVANRALEPMESVLDVDVEALAERMLDAALG